MKRRLSIPFAHLPKGKCTGLLTGFSLCSKSPVHWLGMHLGASNKKSDLKCLQLVVAVLGHIGHAQPCHQRHRQFLLVPPSLCWFSSSSLSLYKCKRAFSLPGFLVFNTGRRGKGKGHSPCRLSLLPPLFKRFVCLHGQNWVTCGLKHHLPMGKRFYDWL